MLISDKRVWVENCDFDRYEYNHCYWKHSLMVYNYSVYYGLNFIYNDELISPFSDFVEDNLFPFSQVKQNLSIIKKCPKNKTQNQTSLTG